MIGILAGEMYSMYATFVAHDLTPVSTYIVDRSTGRRILPGQIGDLVEVFHWEGLLAILGLSFAVLLTTWWAVSAAVRWVRQPDARKIAYVRGAPAFVSSWSARSQRFH